MAAYLNVTSYDFRSWQETMTNDVRHDYNDGLNNDGSNVQIASSFETIKSLVKKNSCGDLEKFVVLLRKLIVVLFWIRCDSENDNDVFIRYFKLLKIP